MAHRVAVRLVEASGRGETWYLATGGVQVVSAHRLGHAVSERSGCLGIADHERRRHYETLADQTAQRCPAAVHGARIGGDVLAQNARHQQVRPLRITAQRHLDEVSRRPVGEARTDPEPVGHPAGTHCWCRDAPSRSTNDTPWCATPKTRARRARRRAQAVCGLLSFILLPYADDETPPQPAVVRMSFASKYSSCDTTESECTAATWLGWITLFPVRPFARSRVTSRISPSRSAAINSARSVRSSCMMNGDSRSSGLNNRSLPEKYSHTGPVRT